MLRDPRSPVCRGAECGVKRGREEDGEPPGKVTGTRFLHRVDEDNFPKLFESQGNLSESPKNTLGLWEGLRRPLGAFAAWEGGPSSPLHAGEEARSPQEEG